MSYIMRDTCQHRGIAILRTVHFAVLARTSKQPFKLADSSRVEVNYARVIRIYNLSAIKCELSNII